MSHTARSSVGGFTENLHFRIGSEQHKAKYLLEIGRYRFGLLLLMTSRSRNIRRQHPNGRFPFSLFGRSVNEFRYDGSSVCVYVYVCVCVCVCLHYAILLLSSFDARTQTHWKVFDNRLHRRRIVFSAETSPPIGEYIRLCLTQRRENALWFGACVIGVSNTHSIHPLWVWFALRSLELFSCTTNSKRFVRDFAHSFNVWRESEMWKTLRFPVCEHSGFSSRRESMSEQQSNFRWLNFCGGSSSIWDSLFLVVVDFSGRNFHGRNFLGKTSR